MSCNNEEINFNIDVNITNLVLTPLTCASLVSKIIKCLIYQKSQIPYPYEWMKTIVDKKRKKLESDNEESTNNQAERHFRVVSKAYDTTESIMNHIKNQFKNGVVIEEILLLFGGSEMNPKEVYRIRIPNIAVGHVETNHVLTNNKLSHTVLRKIILSEEWMTAMDHILPPTNMFLFIKTNGRNTQSLDFFIPNSSFYILKNTLITNINLIYNANSSINCCNNLSVFQDEHNEVNLLNNSENNEHSKDRCEEVSNEDTKWLQADIVFKGFKENVVNKIPLSQLW